MRERPSSLAREPRDENDDEAKRRWEAFFERATSAHPQFRVSPETFSAWVEQRMQAQGELEWDRFDAAGLYLAFACLQGDARALRRLEKLHRRDIEVAFERLRVDVARRDDLEQVVWSDLLVEKRKLERYKGTGSLSNWIRAVAVRRILTALRKVELPIDPVESAGELLVPEDPELLLFRESYGETFREVFREAIEGLDRADRVVLHHRYVDGLTLDRLARALGVHRATAARRLARVRRQLLASVTAGLSERLGLEPEQLRSIVRLVRSQFELSLGPLLEGSD